MNPQIKTTYQGGEALPTIGSTGYNEVLKLSGFQPSNVLDAGNLTQGTSTPTFNFQPVNSASTNLSAQVGSVINGISTAPTATATPTAQPVTDRNTILERLYSLIGMQGEQTGRTADIQEEVGLFKKQEALTKLENDITARAKAWDDQVKELEKNKEGLSDQGLQIRRNALLKDKNSELADLSIQYKVANDDVQGALALAEAKVASEFEPIANEIEALKGLYTLYENDLTESEKVLLQDQIDSKNREAQLGFDKELARYKAELDLSLFGAKNIIETGATVKTGTTDILTAVNDLLTSPGLSNISGIGGQFFGGIAGKGAVAKNRYKQLKGLLSLENRQKLKGSGAISDFEFKVLEQASSALGRNLSDSDFRTELEKIRTALGGSATTSNADPLGLGIK